MLFFGLEKANLATLVQIPTEYSPLARPLAAAGGGWKSNGTNSLLQNVQTPWNCVSVCVCLCITLRSLWKWERGGEDKSDNFALSVSIIQHTHIRARFLKMAHSGRDLQSYAGHVLTYEDLKRIHLRAFRLWSKRNLS